MATKKQKREIAQAKREKWLAEQRESGLREQRKDRENREKKLRDAAKEKHEKEHSWKKREPKCILCQDALAEQRRQEKTAQEAYVDG